MRCGALVLLGVSAVRIKGRSKVARLEVFTCDMTLERQFTPRDNGYCMDLSLEDRKAIRESWGSPSLNSISYNGRTSAH